MIIISVNVVAAEFFFFFSKIFSLSEAAQVWRSVAWTLWFIGGNYLVRSLCSFATAWLRKKTNTGNGEQRADTSMAARAARDSYSRQGTVGSTGPDI